MWLEYVTLGIMIFVGIVIFYGIIAIHDIPYEIAKKRGHPHLEAIHYAGWISMFTLHSIWPFLWIWATIYHADRGYGFSGSGGNTQKILERLDIMEQRNEALENNATNIAPKILERFDVLEQRIETLENNPTNAAPSTVNMASTPKTNESEEV